MNRRQFIGVVAVGFASLSGCVQAPTADRFGNWNPYEENPILKDRGDPGFLIHDGTYYLYPGQATNGDGIEVWESEDGENWEYIDTVLSSNSNNWENKEVGDASVEYRNNRFYLYYSGQGEGLGLTDIGVAVSDSPTGDFTRIDDNPILERGQSGQWDHDRVTEPYVRYHDHIDEFIMTYSGEADSGGTERIGFARSGNGQDWKKYSDNPIFELSVGNGGINDQAHLYFEDEWHLYFTDKGPTERPLKKAKGSSLDELSLVGTVIDTDRKDYSPTIRWDKANQEFKMYWHQMSVQGLQYRVPILRSLLDYNYSEDDYWISLAKSDELI